MIWMMAAAMGRTGMRVRISKRAHPLLLLGKEEEGVRQWEARNGVARGKITMSVPARNITTLY
jgi:hypothetical protein